MYKRKAQGWSKHLDFFIVDEISLQAAFILSCFLRHHALAYDMPLYRSYGFLLILVDAFVLVSLSSMHGVLSRGCYREFLATCKHCLYVFAIMSFYLLATKSSQAYSRIIIYSTLVLHGLLSYTARIIWKKIVKSSRFLSGPRRTMVVVVQSPSAENILDWLLSSEAEGYTVVGVISRDETPLTEIRGIPVVARMDDAADYLCRNWVDSVYVDCSATDPVVAKLMDACTGMGIPVHYHVPAMGHNHVKRFSESIGGTTVLTTSINYATPLQVLVKRCFDILGGIVGSVLALLIMLFVGPVIKISSPGPILFKQTRIGKNGKPFEMYKIRSMVPDAEERKKEFMDQNRVKDGKMFKLDFDPRVIGNRSLPDGTKKTGIGEFIRRTSLDEFPQFFNVLLGQMSLVGTRPPTLDEWEKYDYHHRTRLAIKPGITGLWQVSGRSSITDFEEVVKLDTQYILNWSYGLDIRILLRTVAILFTGTGAL